MKKNVLFIAVIILCIITFIYYYYQPKDYTITYQVGKFEILEKYDKKSQLYFYEIKSGSNTFESVVFQKYSTERRFITTVNKHQSDEITCITTNMTPPLCKNETRQIAYSLVTKELKAKINYKLPSQINLNKKYNKTEINNYRGYTFAIWNYRGFDLISESRQKSLKLFKRDVYTAPIITQINNYILIADYDEAFSFKKFYVIDMLKGRIKEWQIKAEISLDSYILGTKDHSVYLVDRKNKIEYEIVPHKQRMRVIGTQSIKGKILKNGEWEAIGLNKLVSQDYAFSEPKTHNYFIINNQLYLKYFDSKKIIKASNFKIDKIITVINNEVFYLFQDRLYAFNDQTFEQLLLRNFEWNFNNQNVIFIYK